MPEPGATPGERLPPPARPAILAGWPSRLVLRPWFDRAAARLIVRWFLPLSRAWAAALASRGSAERFRAGAYGDPAGVRPSRGTRRLFATIEARRAAYDAAAEAWTDAFFGPRQPSDPVLVAAEIARHRAAHRLMAARSAALPLHLARPFPPLRFEIATPEAMAARHGARLARPEDRFPAPGAPGIRESWSVPTGEGADRWLRFASPVLGDTVWARVSTPVSNPAAPGLAGEAGVVEAPSLIFLHGIAMETEFWRLLIDPSVPMVRRGVRLIRPEGPWHGRRRPEGWFGGEPAMGRGPLGFADLFQAWVAEVAVLIAWARRTGRGPVALGGVSLGALAAQMAAAAARHWPEDMRPDALLLVATTGDMQDMTAAGSLSRALGIWPRLAAAGWSAETLERYLPLLQPQEPPAMDPGRIVMVLGRDDDLLPFAGGLALARRWGVPAENLFLRPQGHFSVSLGLGAAPLERLRAVLGTCRGDLGPDPGPDLSAAPPRL